MTHQNPGRNVTFIFLNDQSFKELKHKVNMEIKINFMMVCVLVKRTTTVGVKVIEWVTYVDIEQDPKVSPVNPSLEWVKIEGENQDFDPLLQQKASLFGVPSFDLCPIVCYSHILCENPATPKMCNRTQITRTWILNSACNANLQLCVLEAHKLAWTLLALQHVDFNISNKTLQTIQLWGYLGIFGAQTNRESSPSTQVSVPHKVF